MSDVPKTTRLHLLQMAGAGLAVGIGMSVSRDLGHTWLTRVLFAALIGGAVAGVWAWIVWLIFVRNRA